jgi:hypothetical protein
MPLDPRSSAVAYLILRHLYDGDIIEWPIADDHPLCEIFREIEAQGFVARWDRIWPLHDRYRLTERGIATIEALYKPSGSEVLFEELRRSALAPQDRRAFLAQRGLDPGLWPILHDPSSHWSTFLESGGRYHAYVWEDQQPPRRTRRSKPSKPSKPSVARGTPVARFHQHHHHHHRDRDHLMMDREPREGLVDLDHQAPPPDVEAPEQGDYDVS